MTYVSNAINARQRTCEIDFSFFGESRRGCPAKDLVAVLNCLEAVVDVSHIPVDPGTMDVALEKLPKLVKHLLFECVVMACNLGQGDPL